MKTTTCVLNVFLCVLAVMPTKAALVYSEYFDDGNLTVQLTAPEVCWDDNGATIPVSSSTPLCMIGRALRTNGSTQDPVIGIDLRSCTGTATLSYVYYQFANAGVSVERATASSGTMNCDTASGFVAYETLSTLESCVDETVPLTAGMINYVRWNHGTGTNYLAIDDLEIDATCSEPACVTVFNSTFGTIFQSGTICALFPALWETCSGNGPYISTSSPCGSSGDCAMALGTGYPYSTADTVCMDLTGLTSATLSYSYSWDGTTGVSPRIRISTDGGGSWSILKPSHDNTLNGCLAVCIDLSAYIGNPDVRFRFESQSSSTSYHAYFDDITLNPNGTCPATPTPTWTPTRTPTTTPPTTPPTTPTTTTTPTDTPTEPPTPTSSEGTPEPTATLEPSATPTEIPTETPSATATPSTPPTDTPTEIPSDTPTAGPTSTPLPVPAAGTTANVMLIALLSILVSGYVFRRK